MDRNPGAGEGSVGPAGGSPPFANTERAKAVHSPPSSAGLSLRRSATVLTLSGVGAFISVLAEQTGPSSSAYANRTNLLSGHARFLLDRGEAEAMFERIVGTVRDGWQAGRRRNGASERDCHAVAAAFLYDGLFYEDPSGI